MRTLSYVHCDVFTDRPFGGNPLVVFPEAGELSYDEMLAIARELNHSETAFVFPSTTPEAVRKVRIFTPQREIPFAGHPVVGAAVVLAVEVGLYEGDGQAIRLQLKNGIAHVEFSDMDAGGYAAAISLGRPELGSVSRDRMTVARAIGLREEEIDDIAPPQVASVGLPWLFVPLIHVQSVERITPNLEVIHNLSNNCGAVGVYAFSMERVDDDSDVRARAFVPSLGVTEDPATGSAAGALAGYLHGHHYLGDGSRASLRISQGTEVDRPSEVRLDLSAEGGELTNVRVGGCVTFVGRGELVV